MLPQKLVKMVDNPPPAKNICIHPLLYVSDICHEDNIEYNISNNIKYNITNIMEYKIEDNIKENLKDNIDDNVRDILKITERVKLLSQHICT